MATQLTTAQLATFKSAIQANTATIPSGQTWTNSFAGVQVKFIPNTPDGNATVAGWYNQQANPNFFGNFASVQVNDILNAITWKNFTPTDAVPVDTALNVAIWNARNAMCQTLQMNVQNLIIGRLTIDATKGKIRSGFQDSLSTVPSGTGGANQDAGWAAVQKILCRKGTFGEALFADTSSGNGGGNTTAATFTFEGLLVPDDVNAVLS